MTIPRARTNSERSIFAQAPVRDDDIAARQSVSFSCPRGHDFTVCFADDASVPTAWECRQHGVMARRKDAADRHEPVTKRSHWDLLLRRRPRTELAQLLDEQLAALRAGHLVSVDQWLAMSNERSNPKRATAGPVTHGRLPTPEGAETSPPSASPSTPDSVIAAMFDRAELQDVVCYGFTAQSATGYPLPPVTGDGDSDPEMVIRAQLQPDGLTVRVIVRVYTTDALLKVDIGAVYSIPGILEDSAQAMVRFIVDSAMPTIHPFVREIIADTSRRVGFEQYLITSLESPRVSDTILNGMTEDLTRRQQEVIAESRSETD